MMCPSYIWWFGVWLLVLPLAARAQTGAVAVSPAAKVAVRVQVDRAKDAASAPDGAFSYVPLALTFEMQRKRFSSLRQVPSTEGMRLRGLVIDATLTKLGRDFYLQFFQYWEPPAVQGFYTIEITERPTPGRGTLVEARVNDDILFRSRLQTDSDIDTLALTAARRVYQYVRSGQGLFRVY
ncbi:CsgE family curli-type amyloid fiber assembly protein [Salisaeta longa]|uniref:CsgE family curli-type amyloid fiber assembly protein n=1 Tax=Salisaeta longa TaxID=503170 RepID=UPI00058CB2E0|nr:CsgE family curli-type amyloid fiber assembly protein [Salisaeta longa]